MLNRLPDFIDPVAFADRQRQLQGEIPLNKLNRLSDVLTDDNGSVKIELSFDRQGRVPVISGHLKTKLKVICQNCLKPMDLSVEENVNLGIVLNLEQADLLATDLDPLLLEEERISLNQIIEDELLLALPAFPRHQDPCLNESASTPTIAESEPEPQSTNPFAVLAQLKNTGD